MQPDHRVRPINGLQRPNPGEEVGDNGRYDARGAEADPGDAAADVVEQEERDGDEGAAHGGAEMDFPPHLAEQALVRAGLLLRFGTRRGFKWSEESYYGQESNSPVLFQRGVK